MEDLTGKKFNLKNGDPVEVVKDYVENGVRAVDILFHGETTPVTYLYEQFVKLVGLIEEAVEAVVEAAEAVGEAIGDAIEAVTEMVSPEESAEEKPRRK